MSIRETWYEQETEEAPQDKHSDDYKPGNKSRYPEPILQDEKDSLHRNSQKLSDKFGVSPENTTQTKSKETPSWTERIPQKFPKIQDVGNAPCKNIQSHNIEYTNCDEQIRLTMGRESAALINSKMGHPGKHRSKYADHLNDASIVATNEQLHGLWWNLDSFVE